MKQRRDKLHTDSVNCHFKSNTRSCTALESSAYNSEEHWQALSCDKTLSMLRSVFFLSKYYNCRFPHPNHILNHYTSPSLIQYSYAKTCVWTFSAPSPLHDSSRGLTREESEACDSRWPGRLAAPRYAASRTKTGMSKTREIGMRDTQKIIYYQEN